MPVGVPKLPYRLPGDEDETWVDLYNVMYRDRTLFLIQELQDDIANQIMGILTYINLDEEDDNSEINLYINSPGGSLFSGLGIYDTMQSVDAPVCTYCLGMAASMASVILMGGEVEHRVVFPHSRVMIHQPVSGYYDGQAGECTMEALEILRLRDRITQLYRQWTGRDTLEISYDLERDYFMSAYEAIEYGIADIIGTNLSALRVKYEALYNMPTYEPPYERKKNEENGNWNGKENGNENGNWNNGNGHLM